MGGTGGSRARGGHDRAMTPARVREEARGGGSRARGVGARGCEGGMTPARVREEARGEGRWGARGA